MPGFTLHHALALHEIALDAAYFGLTDWSPPAAPGGGMTGIGSAEPGGIRLIWGSTPAGGIITPPERAKSELLSRSMAGR